MRLAVVNFHFERPEITKFSLENNLKYWSKYSNNIDYYCIFVNGKTKKFPQENNFIVKKEILKIIKNYKNVKFIEINNKLITEDTCFSSFKEIVINNNYDGCFVIEDDIIISSSYFNFGINSIEKILSTDNNFYSLSLYGSTDDILKIGIIKKSHSYTPWGIFISKVGIIHTAEYMKKLINFKTELKLSNNNEDLSFLSEKFFISLGISRKPGGSTLGILGGDGLSSHVANHYNLNMYESLYSRAFNIGILGEHNPESIDNYKIYLNKINKSASNNGINIDIHHKKIILNQENITKDRVIIYND